MNSADRPTEGRRPTLLGRVVGLYVDGFREMTVGRSLWALIIIKVLILMGVFKLFFFPDVLQSRYDTDSERAQSVRSALAGRSAGAASEGANSLDGADEE